MMKSGNVSEQKTSSLLTRDENERLIKMLGHRCQTLATTVVQLFSTSGPDGTQWVKRDAGVLCLVRDANRRSYFFRIYCLTRAQLIWEHEVYNSMQYNSPRSFLHTFEAEECIVAFSFASESEATHLRNVLLEKLRAKEKKRLERRKANTAHPKTMKAAPPRPSGVSPFNTNVSVSNGPSPQAPLSAINNNFKRNKIRGTKKKWTKADIGTPQNFVHVTHVGWNPSTGFDLTNVEDPQLQEFFKRAGVSESHLQDEGTREFIYEFIEKHGGLEAVKEDIDPRQRPKKRPSNHQAQSPKPPPLPVRGPPTAPSSSPSMRVAPPPPPKSSPRINANPPPPPPPPIQTIPTRLQESTKVTVSSSSAVGSPAPPPPPPPPLPPLTVSVPSPALNSSKSEEQGSSGNGDVRDALMNAIRSGKTLRHVETESKKVPEDNRGELLNQIRQGVELKAVQQPAKTQPSGPLDGLAGALAKALAERSKAIYGDESSASESDDDYDDDEWED